MTRPKSRLFFLHVQKTGGAALTGAISNRFRECDCLLLYYSPEPDVSGVDSLRYVSGHVPLSFIELYREPPFVFTFLRDPVERALSHYSFLRTRPSHFANQILLFGRGREAYERAAECVRLAHELSIEQMIEQVPEIAIEYFGNRQARALGSTRPEGGDETLERALDGLERCDFVGITERLEEATAWLTRRLGWRELTPIPRVNVTPGRLRREQLSPTGLSALLELTAVDRELYRHGVERYQRELSDWERAGRPRDDALEIDDAEPVSDLRFDQAIQGAGWQGRESDGARSFCWMGDPNRATVQLTAPPLANSAVVEIAHAVDSSVLEGLRISVEGRRLRHVLMESGDTVNAAAPMKRRRLGWRRRTVMVDVELDHALRPCDLDPATPDDRRLSIAVSRISLGRR